MAATPTASPGGMCMCMHPVNEHAGRCASPYRAVHAALACCTCTCIAACCNGCTSCGASRRPVGFAAWLVAVCLCPTDGRTTLPARRPALGGDTINSANGLRASHKSTQADPGIAEAVGNEHECCQAWQRSMDGASAGQSGRTGACSRRGGRKRQAPGWNQQPGAVGTAPWRHERTPVSWTRTFGGGGAGGRGVRRGSGPALHSSARRQAPRRTGHMQPSGVTHHR